MVEAVIGHGLHILEGSSPGNALLMPDILSRIKANQKVIASGKSLLRS